MPSLNALMPKIVLGGCLLAQGLVSANTGVSVAAAFTVGHLLLNVGASAKDSGLTKMAKGSIEDLDEQVTPMIYQDLQRSVERWFDTQFSEEDFLLKRTSVFSRDVKPQVMFRGGRDVTECHLSKDCIFNEQRFNAN